MQTMLCLCNVYTSKANTNTQASFQTDAIDFIIQSVLLIRPTIEAEAFISLFGNGYHQPPILFLQ
jgi:hypothetical protein